MKRIEIDNCYQCLYYQTFGGRYCGKIVGTKLLTAKEAKNIPDWCPLPDVEEKKEEKGSYKDNFPKISPDDFAKARDSIGLRFNR